MRYTLCAHCKLKSILLSLSMSGTILSRVGNGISFQKKFRGIDLEWFPLFRGRKCSFRGIPSSAEEQIPKLGTERNGAETNS
jgi:hypothetical protein